MTAIRKLSRLQVVSWLCLLSLTVYSQLGHGENGLPFSLGNEPPHRSAGSSTGKLHNVSALLVGDIHFDPFDDPSKVQQVDAPMEQWSSVVSGPAPSSQQQDFAALQQKCHARGFDAPYALLQSSLAAIRTTQPDAQFIAVSGDLIAHSFFCRYATLTAGTERGAYQTIVLKTLSFVMQELRAFPGAPVYPSLGDNDTACDDYRVVTASNRSGAAATWSTEHDYAEAYGKTQFSPSAVSELIADFANDRNRTDGSQPAVHAQLLRRRQPFRTEAVLVAVCLRVGESHRPSICFARMLCRQVSRDFEGSIV